MAVPLIEKPQFRIIVNSKTGRQIGRIYFPKLYICQNREPVKNWLEQKKIYFTQKDVNVTQMEASDSTLKLQSASMSLSKKRFIPKKREWGVGVGER
jgi:hypothetical protein